LLPIQRATIKLLSAMATLAVVGGYQKVFAGNSSEKVAE
jgi:hypothetical protein